MSNALPFNSIYRHDFVRVAVCVPKLRVADPDFNVNGIIELALKAANEHAALAIFPELGLSGYSNDDLFHQEALLDGVITALDELLAASKAVNTVLVVGAPLRFEGKLFNCAVIIQQGVILGVVPKTYLPNYREFYEKRQFCAARQAVRNTQILCGQSVPFGNDLIFSATTLEDFSFHTEICEDLWTPLPPSTLAALAGASVLTNLSASNITVGKAQFRRDLCASQSGRCVSAYLYASAGHGESTTDLAWDGHGLIFENGNLLVESERFSDHEQLIVADIDLERLAQDRMRLSSFNDCVADHREAIANLRVIHFDLELPQIEIPLKRYVPRYPFVPDDNSGRDQRCYEAYNIQVQGLIKRLESSGIDKLVIGISGGLDSTHALIVAARTMDRLQLPRENILAYTMPGYATSDDTKSNAWALMRALGVTAEEIDIRPSCEQMLKDLGHPFADGEPQYDITFENVQAGQRTSHLFRLANHHKAFVLGTGDLSEAALGWCTYGVGDHMSHYNVNASVPKTLIQYLLRWIIQTDEFGKDVSSTLKNIVATEISPELIPADSGQPIQSTEQSIGPYELQDFNTYYITRFGFKPSKVAFLAQHAWSDATKGRWPEADGVAARNQYSLAEIKKWLGVFLWRFFKTSQFKRSATPNGPKVGSGGSLSPRGDWRAPSDSEATVWLTELEKNVPD